MNPPTLPSPPHPSLLPFWVSYHLFIRILGDLESRCFTEINENLPLSGIPNCHVYWGMMRRMEQGWGGSRLQEELSVAAQLRLAFMLVNMAERKETSIPWVE